MKARQNLGKWLAAALVAAAGMVLLGCPHNNLIDGGGGGASGGSRGGSGGVQLVVSNFVDGGPVADRTGWLGGPSRTIAPEHIDLTVADEINKYVFVASATGDGTWGPKFVDIAPGSGVAPLEGLGGGSWEVTLEAYDVTKLSGKQDINGTNKADIMAQTQPDKVQAQRATALVLSGGATVDTSSGAQVTLTLTGDTVEGEGTVDVAVYFTTPTDVTEIFDSQKEYTVTAQLVSQATGQPVAGSEMTLYKKGPNPPGGQDVDTDPGSDFTYRTHDPVQTDKYKEETIKTEVGKKLLEYKPTTGGAPGTPLEIPKGRYLLRVTVTTPDGDELYRSDPDFYVDPQREVKQAFEIQDLLGTKPKELEKFGVYWTKPASTDQLEGYDATFVWEENDFNAAGYTIELADITNVYRYDNGKPEIEKNTGWGEFNESDDLLVEVRQLAKVRPVMLDWQSAPQDNLDFPKWQSGFLLQGNTQLTVRLQSGHVYAARIRASNGSSSHSDWLYLGKAQAPNDPGGGKTEFEVANTKGIFGLVKVAYNLLGTMDMYTLKDDRSTDWQVQPVGGTNDVKVEGEDLLQVHPYTPGTSITLTYGFDGNTVAANKADEQVLTARGNTLINRAWQGWQDTRTGKLFGPLATPPQVTKADWKYDGWSDLSLKPVGAGGSDIRVLPETAGTFVGVASKDTVGFSMQPPNGTSESKILQGLTEFTQGQTTPDVYRNTGITRLAAVIGGTQGTPTPPFSLYVSVGKAEVDLVKLPPTDENGNPVEVEDLVVEVLRSGSEQALRTGKGFTRATGNVPAYVVFDDTNGNSLAGLRSGNNYILRVRVTTGQGYTVGTQFPLSILYENGPGANTATIP